MWDVSIHAPVKVRTRQIGKELNMDYRFNPRTREGANGVSLSGSAVNIVSIHAPVKVRT